jgi:hypothetical protein
MMSAWQSGGLLPAKMASTRSMSAARLKTPVSESWVERAFRLSSFHHLRLFIYSKAFH